MFSWRPTCHARASRSTTSRRRAWFVLLLGGIYTTQEPASIAQAVLPPREPEAMPRSRPSRGFVNTSSLGAKFLKCLSCRLPHLPLTFWLRVRWPIRPHAPLPHRAIRRPISQGPPVRPAIQPGSFLGLLGPRGPVVGLFVRAHEPDTHFRHPLSWHESTG